MAGARGPARPLGHGSSCVAGSPAAGGVVMRGAAAPPRWRQAAAQTAALLLLLAPVAAAATSHAGAEHLAGTAAVGIRSAAPRRQLLASGSVGAGGIAGAPALLRHPPVCLCLPVGVVMTAHTCAGLLATRGGDRQTKLHAEGFVHLQRRWQRRLASELADRSECPGWQMSARLGYCKNNFCIMQASCWGWRCWPQRWAACASCWGAALPAPPP